MGKSRNNRRAQLVGALNQAGRWGVRSDHLPGNVRVGEQQDSCREGSGQLRGDEPQCVLETVLADTGQRTDGHGTRGAIDMFRQEIEMMSDALASRVDVAGGKWLRQNLTNVRVRYQLIPAVGFQSRFKPADDGPR